MSDETPDPARTAWVDITMGFDGVGDPLLHMEFHVPDGGELSPDAVEGMALHMLGTVAQARANAMISRKLMLDGMSPREVVRFLQSVMLT